jgi:hypothetical protein
MVFTRESPFDHTETAPFDSGAIEEAHITIREQVRGSARTVTFSKLTESGLGCRRVFNAHFFKVKAG